MKIKTLNTPLSEFPFSVRTYNSLRRGKCETLNDVLNTGRKNLSGVIGIGKGTIEEVEKVLADNNCIELFKY